MASEMFIFAWRFAYNQHFSQVGDAGIEPATSAVWTLEDLLKGD